MGAGVMTAKCQKKKNRFIVNITTEKKYKNMYCMFKAPENLQRILGTQIRRFKGCNSNKITHWFL